MGTLSENHQPPQTHSVRPAARRLAALLRVWGHVGICVACMALLNGCATRALWTGEWVESFHEPSSPSHLQLFQISDGTDVIVQYDELAPWSEVPQRRCYYLQRGLVGSKVARGRKPRFVPTSTAQNARLIPPCVDSAEPSVSASTDFNCVIISENGLGFTLVRSDGGHDGPYLLPVYRGFWGTTRLVALTPLAIATDATIIGAIWACFASQGMAGQSYRL